MKLYCFGHSGHSYKVALYLRLVDAPCEYEFVDFFNGEARSPEYRALNPMGEVPVLIDGEDSFTQSNAILSMLAARFGAFQGRSDEAFEIERWLHWDSHKGSSTFGLTRFLVNYLPEKYRNDDVMAFQIGRTKASIATLEDALENKDWIVGDAPSIADISLSSYLFYPEPFGWENANTPNINKWLSNIQNIPGWVHPYELMPTDQAIISRSNAALKSKT